MDLLGSDLPVEGEKGMKFAWSDGILLQVGAFFVAVTIIEFSLLEFKFICPILFIRVGSEERKLGSVG